MTQHCIELALGELLDVVEQHAIQRAERESAAEGLRNELKAEGWG